MKEAGHAAEALPPRGDHSQAAPSRGAARRRQEGAEGRQDAGCPWGHPQPLAPRVRRPQGLV